MALAEISRQCNIDLELCNRKVVCPSAVCAYFHWIIMCPISKCRR